MRQLNTANRIPLQLDWMLKHAKNYFKAFYTEGWVLNILWLQLAETQLARRTPSRTRPRISSRTWWGKVPWAQMRSLLKLASNQTLYQALLDLVWLSQEFSRYSSFCVCVLQNKLHWGSRKQTRSIFRSQGFFWSLNGSLFSPPSD